MAMCVLICIPMCFINIISCHFVRVKVDLSLRCFFCRCAVSGYVNAVPCQRLSLWHQPSKLCPINCVFYKIIDMPPGKNNSLKSNIKDELYFGFRKLYK